MKRVSKVRYALGLVFPVLVTVWLVLPDELFIASLFKAFLLQALLFLPLLIIFFLWKKWRGLTIGSLIAVVLLLAFLFPHLKNGSNAEPVDNDFSVAQFNVKRTNSSYSDVIEKILHSEADLVSVQEIDRKWLNKLQEGLSEEYSWSFGLPDESGFYGVAVFSKYPAVFEKKTLVGLENVSGTCSTPFGEVHFLSSHLHTPTTPRNYQLRNRHLELISEWAQTKKSPTVVFGDFNTVPWDSNLDCLVRNAHLARSSGGWLPTYPANVFPLIPIDHVFHSSDFDCQSFEGFDIPGSDHRGVVAGLSIKTDRTQSAVQSR